MAATPLNDSGFRGTTESLYILLDKFILLISKSQLLNTFHCWVGIFTVALDTICNPSGIVHNFTDWFTSQVPSVSYVTIISKFATQRDVVLLRALNVECPVGDASAPLYWLHRRGFLSVCAWRSKSPNAIPRKSVLCACLL